MQKYLVIGDPIGHSRSPGMQNAAFRACGLGEPYGIRRITPEELPEFFEFARKNLCGVNLTVPHKIHAAELADELTPRAAQCGSVNTLIIKDNVILGDSTDGVGLERALIYNFKTSLAGKKILFCGAGGAARATAVHLAQCGTTEVSFINRTLSKAEELAALCQKIVPELICRCTTPDNENSARELLANADFLIQATTLGLKPEDPPPLPLEWFSANMKLKIFDTIYHQTPLQKYAGTMNIACAGGKEMLIQQGAESFTCWTGIPAPLDAMRDGFDHGSPGK